MKTTEQDSRYDSLEKMGTEELLLGMNAEDRGVPEAVAGAIPAIGRMVDGIVERGGRVIYAGAGTSGRLGIVDASEIPPTFGVKGKFEGIIAGGDGAIRNAVEGAEDSLEAGASAIASLNIGKADAVIGISASGGAPYVIGAIREARRRGALTGCICCNSDAALALEADVPMIAVTGPEFVTGSTRLKAGTATKLILNMISTATMIRLGHVKGNKMVDMQLTNKKLVDRGTRMIVRQTGLPYDEARELLLRHRSVREAINAYKS